MKEVTVTGASDDLIEIDGAIVEEFYLKDDCDGDGSGDLLAFSTGVVLRITYSKSGVWRIVPVVDPAGAVTIQQAPEDDDANYTDRASVPGAEWVVHGVGFAKTKSSAS